MLQNHVWVKDPFKVEDKWILLSPVYKKFWPDFRLQLLRSYHLLSFGTVSKYSLILYKYLQPFKNRLIYSFFQLHYLCAIRLPSYPSIKTINCNRFNADANKSTQLSSIMPERSVKVPNDANIFIEIFLKFSLKIL